MNRPNIYKLDDELLSAYLDNELSSDERAAVEARLAADPSAQQLLQDLRSVSQSIQALPLETMGRDISAEVVQRAHGVTSKATPPLSITQPSAAVDNSLRVKIFRTPRAWIWATLAMAAGLVIMIVQSGDERAKNLPPLAQRNERAKENQPAADAIRRDLREPSGTADHEALPPAAVALERRELSKTPAPPAAAPSQSMGHSTDVATDRAPAGPPYAVQAPEAKNDNVSLKAGPESGIATSSASAPTHGAYVPTPEAGGTAFAVGGKLATDGTADKVKLGERDKELMIVQVLARPAALQNKSLDQLLMRRGIRFEPDRSADKAPNLAARRYAKQAENAAAASTPTTIAAANQNVDVVLVEAPAPAIAACLADLNQDIQNYAGISVEGPAELTDRSDSKLAAPKKTGDDFQKYNRGSMPQQRSDAWSLQDHYFGYSGAGESAAPSTRNGGEVQSGIAPKESSPVVNEELKKSGPENVGRARRLAPLGAGTMAGGERSRDEASRLKLRDEASKKLAPDRDVQQRAKPQAANLHVLFVVRPEDAAAPGTPAESPAK
jgi:hypothetical protein